MRGFIPAVLAVALLAAKAIALPPPQVKLLSPLRLIPQTKLVELLEKEDLCWTQPYRDGSIRQVSTAVLIEAPIQRVWSRLCDYEHQARWVPGLKRSLVLRRRGAKLSLLREYEVPGNNLEFRYELLHRPMESITVSLKDGDGLMESGRWRLDLFEVDGGRRTLLIRDGHMLMR